MLMPKQMKFRRPHRLRRIKGIATRGALVSFGDYALMSLEAGWITSRQIESARRTITNYVKRGGKVWIRIFPDRPITQKPAETRMGSGKGSVEYYVAVIKPGRVLFEINGVTEDTAQEAMRRAAQKLPVKCKFISRASLEVGNEG
jgi:large subunit ribosomal protein L16